MLIIEHTEETNALPERIWAIWRDVENWNTWDDGLEYSNIDGPFQAGTTGKLKPRGGPLLETRLTQVEPMLFFIDEARLPLTRIIVSHSMRKLEGKIQVTHRIEMKGMLSWLFAILIGRNMKKNLPYEMKAMLKKAEM